MRTFIPVIVGFGLVCAGIAAGCSSSSSPSAGSSGTSGDGGGGADTGGSLLAFGAVCTQNSQCASNDCFDFNAHGSYCTEPCPADPTTCPNSGGGCNGMNQCKVPATEDGGSSGSSGSSGDAATEGGGSLPFGSICTGNSECASNDCVDFPGKGASYCTEPCPTDPSQCPNNGQGCNGMNQCKAP